MKESLRLKFQKLADGDAEAMPVCYQVYHLKQCEQACDWLIKNKIQGKRLVEFFNHGFGASNLRFLNFLLQKVKQDKDYVPTVSDLNK